MSGTTGGGSFGQGQDEGSNDGGFFDWIQSGDSDKKGLFSWLRRDSSEREAADTGKSDGTGAEDGAVYTGKSDGAGAEDDAVSDSQNGKTGKKKNRAKPGDYRDPVNLKKQYPIIDADGAIDFYPKTFMTVIGTWGFGSYSYIEDDAKLYMAGLNELAERMKGKATVYNMPIPLSSSIKIPDAHWQALSSIPQGEAIGNILSLGSDKVMQVQVYNILMKHRKEYVYFHTDHHWTAKGAYYAYRHFCARKGIRPNKLSAYRKETTFGYLGYYANTTKDPDLLNHPDKVTVYYPLSEAVITTTKPVKDGGETWKDDQVVVARPDYAAAFIHGDNAFCDIKNKDIKKGESCVVIKDSFGNAFVPFLVDHYKHVYVADFRYCEKTVPQIVEEYGVDDIIFAINIANLRNGSVVGELVQMTR